MAGVVGRRRFGRFLGVGGTAGKRAADLFEGGGADLDGEFEGLGWRRRREALVFAIFLGGEIAGEEPPGFFVGREEAEVWVLPEGEEIWTMTVPPWTGSPNSVAMLAWRVSVSPMEGNGGVEEAEVFAFGHVTLVGHPAGDLL